MTVNTANIKKAQAKTLVIFKPQGPDWCSRTGLCLGTSYKVYTATFVQGSLAVNGGQDDPPPALFARYHPSGRLPFSKSEVRAGWPFAVSKQVQDNLGRGYVDHH